MIIIFMLTIIYVFQMLETYINIILLVRLADFPHGRENRKKREHSWLAELKVCSATN